MESPQQTSQTEATISSLSIQQDHSVTNDKQKSPTKPLESSSPSADELSSDIILKIERLRAGTRQLPNTFKRFFDVSKENIDQNVYFSATQKIMMFELFELSTLQTLFNEVKQQLTKELIQQNKMCAACQRAEFYEILSSQLMSLITVSKFEINNLCLVGFDIYVGPYEAILDIINRLTTFTSELQSRLSLPNVEQMANGGKISKESAIREGFEYFKVYSYCHLIDLNLYCLGEYCKKAAKALDKRSREIIFTGCHTLFDQLTPVLVALRLHSLLATAASTNTELLLMHPSYDYFRFFTGIPIKPEFEYLLESIKPIIKKSLLTYTLTPFMFGVLRNYEIFANFLREMEHQVWVKYANVIVQGIVIVLKSGSLRFREITDLLHLAIQTSCLSNQIFQTAIANLSKPNGEEWVEVDSFFRSAIKAGYNTGIYPALNRLDNDAMEIKLKDILYVGLASLKDCSDSKKIQEWLSMLDSQAEVQQQKLSSLLVESLKPIDPQFGLACITTTSQYTLPNTLELSAKQVNSLLHRVVTLLKILKICHKDYLQVESFRQYLLTIATSIHQKYQSIACQELAQYVLIAGFNTHQTFLANLKTLQQLPLSPEFHASYLKRTVEEHNKEQSARDILDYALICLRKGSIASETLTLIEKTYLQPLTSYNQRYLRYSFEGVNVVDLPKRLAHVTGFYSQQQLSNIIETLYTIDASNTLRLNPINTIDIAEPISIKTLNEQIITDLVYIELSQAAQHLLSILIDNIILGFSSQNTTEFGHRCLELLNSLSRKYPIIDYFILNYSVQMSQIQAKLSEQQHLPMYMHFGYVLVRLSKTDQICLDFLLRLLTNRTVITKQAEPLIKKLITPNIIGLLVKSVKDTSKDPHKQTCLEQLTMLCRLVEDPRIVYPDIAKTISFAAMSVLRSIAQDCLNQQVIELLALFDRFVRIDVRDNYTQMIKELTRENIRFGFDQNIPSPINVDFPHCEVVILGQQADKEDRLRLQAAFEKESINTKLHPSYEIDPSHIKFVIQHEKDKLPLKPTQQKLASSAVKPYDELSDILTDNMPFIEEYMHHHTHNNISCSTYRYPQLSFKQICVCVEHYIRNENSQAIFYAVMYCKNSAVTVILIIGIYLFGVEAYQNSLHFKELTAQLIKHKCLSLIERIGFIRVLNLKVKQLTNLPQQLILFKQNSTNPESSLISLFLKRLLQEKEFNFEAFFTQFLTEAVLSHSQQLMYNTSLEDECINLIQKQLTIKGICRLSPLIHANPETLRTYMNSLIEGMAKMNLPSRLLSYHEYIKLTGEWQSDKEFLELFKVYKVNWEFYYRILKEKQQASTKESMIGLHYKSISGKDINTSISEYRNEVETNNANVLSKLSEVVSRSHLSDTLRRHSELYRTLQSTPGIQPADLEMFSLISIFKNICLLFQRGIVPSDFIVHNKYNSQLLLQNDVQLSKYIEFWEENVQCEESEHDKHFLENTQNIVTTDLKQLAYLPAEPNLRHPLYAITADGQQSDPNLLWHQQIEHMQNSNLISTTNKEVNFLPCDKEHLNQFRILGCILGYLLSKEIAVTDKFTKQITYYIKRQRLPWTLVEQNDKQAYNVIMDILAKDSVKDMNLTFEVRHGDTKLELLPKGSEKKVNDYNKKQYCNLLALTTRPNIREQSQHFLDGIYVVLSPNSPKFQLLSK